MIKWLRLFIVWVATIFVASANEESLHGWQQLLQASNEAAPATTTGHTAFPPVQREIRTAENALNTRKKAKLQTDESDDDLLKIGLRTRGAYPSYPSSFGQSSRSGVTSVLTENPIHLANNHEPFKSDNHQLFLYGVSLDQVNSLASSCNTRRDLSDFDKTRGTDASASTKHDIPSPTNSPESLSEFFNLGRKTQLQNNAPITQGHIGNLVTRKENGGRGVKRKIWNSWGDSLSLKIGVTVDENEAQHSDATLDFLSGFPSEQPKRLSAEENCIVTPQFNPQEIQKIIQLSQLGSNTPSYQNAGAFEVPVLSAGGRIPWEMSSMARQNGENDLLSLKPPEKMEAGKSWGADQGTTSYHRSHPQHSLSANQNTLVKWTRSTETLLNQAPRPNHKIFESENQGSSSEDPENVTQGLKMSKNDQSETITTFGNHPSQIDGIKNYGRMKFTTDLFKGGRPSQFKGSYVVRLLNSIPRPYQGNFLLTDDQLYVACKALRRRYLSLISSLQMSQVRIFMGNIDRWYQYWHTHAKIDLKKKYFPNVHHGKEVSRTRFILPLFLLYVEMIISIIPFKQDIPSDVELDYPQLMSNAIQSYMEYKRLMKNPPENGESKIWKEKLDSFKKALDRANEKPSTILWIFIEFWMESHYAAVWNKVKESNCLHVSRVVKAFFNTIFTHGIETLNEKLMEDFPLVWNA